MLRVTSFLSFKFKTFIWWRWRWTENPRWNSTTKAYWDVPVYTESMKVNQLDTCVGITNVHSRKVILLEIKYPWVENWEAIKEHTTWRLELERQVSGLKDLPVLHHVTCRAWWSLYEENWRFFLCDFVLSTSPNLEPFFSQAEIRTWAIDCVVFSKVKYTFILISSFFLYIWF